MITILFFSTLRDLAKADEIIRPVPSPATIAGLLAELQREYPDLINWKGRLLVSVNLDYATPETELKAGDEVALMPPVQGG